MQTQQTYTQDIQAPLVSFIITTYNLPIQYLKECIDSILQLSLNAKEREIILVDDGSDICPLDEMAEYLQHIIYLRQPNQGVSVARNYGIQIAKGNFIQFVDGDDYLIQTAYEHCLDIVRYHQPDIVTFNFANSKAKEEVPYELPTPISGTEYLNKHCTDLLVPIYLDTTSSVASSLLQASYMEKMRNLPLSCSCVPKESSRWILLLISTGKTQTL